MKQRKTIEELNDEARDRMNGITTELTTQGKFEKMLYSYGIFEKDAHEIMEFVKPKLASMNDYRMTWNRPASEYPESIYTVVFILMKPMVVEWAKEHIPQAWWIQAFED